MIYLVRHGRAEDGHALGDEARALTADGRREFRELASGVEPAALVRLARKLGDGWALVGHNPGMALALAEMLALPQAPSFRKGAIAALEATSASKWQLAWVVSPGRKKERSL